MEELYFKLHFTKKDIDIIIEELDIQGNHQELVESIKKECLLQAYAYSVYCGEK